MKKLITTLLLLIGVTTLRAQLHGQARADSLEKVLATMPEDSSRLQVLFLLDSTYGTFNREKASWYSHARLNLAKKLGLQWSLGGAYISMVYSFGMRGQFDSGILYGLMADSLAQRIGNKKLQARALVNIGFCYEEQGKHIPALDYWLRGLSLAETLHDSMLIAVLDQDIALIFYDQSNYKKAQSYLDQGLPVAEHRHDYYAITKLLEMTANNLTKLGDYSWAHAALHRSLDMHLAHNDSAGVATAYTMLTGTFDSIPRGYDSVIYYGNKAKAIWDKIDPDNYMAVAAASNVAYNLYGMAMDTSRLATPRSPAEKHRLLLQSEAGLRAAIESMKKNHHTDEIVQVYQELSEVQVALHNYKDAYESLLANRTISDSLFSQENKNKLASLDEEHEIALRDKQLQINAIELASQRKQRWLLIAGVVLLLVIGALLYWQSRTRKKTNTVLLRLNNELDEANEIKTRFFSILNHDLRAPVSNLINFLRLQQDAPDLLDEKARAGHAHRIRNNAENLLQTMEDLLLWSKGQMRTFQPNLKSVPVVDLFDDLKNYFSGVTSVTTQSSSTTISGAGPGNISFQFEYPDSMTLTTDEHYLKTIMRNLTNNAVKALDGTAGATISWKAWQEGGKSYLSVTDNGPGVNDQQLKALYDDSAPVGIKTGLGLHVVRDLARAISCLISVDSRPGEGTEFRLAL